MSLTGNGICLFNFVVREILKDFYERLYTINKAGLPIGTFGQEVLLQGKIKLGRRSKIEARAIVSGNISIGCGTHISAGAIVLGDLTIGNNCFIECGAVVLTDVPDDSYVSGNPATFVKNKKKFLPAIFPAITEAHTVKETQLHRFFPWMVNCGKRVCFGEQIYIEGGADITIGNNTKIRDRVVLATSHHVHKKKENFIDTQQKWYPIVIGANVDIGEGAIIRGGVKIGNNAKILPGSVVVKDIADGSIVSGAPAKPNLRESNPAHTVFPHITNVFAVYGHMYSALNYFSQFPQVKIGRNALINKELCVVGNQMVSIGRNSLIAPRAIFVTQTPMASAPISVGDHSWIGAGAIICPGTIIGTGAVIGAGSVVPSSVPAYEIWAGNPAKKIGVRGSNA